MQNEIQSGSPEDWLRRAHSDLALACGRLRRSVLPEDLCFHAQQAVEKSLKAVLISNGIDFSRTHNLRILIDTLPETVFRDPILDSSVLFFFRHILDETAFLTAEAAAMIEEHRRGHPCFSGRLCPRNLRSVGVSLTSFVVSQVSAYC